MNFDLKEKIPRFATLMDKADPSIFEGSYPKKYFQLLSDSRHYYLTIYADLLSRVLNEAGLNPRNSILIDYGCGNGLLGLFASYAGFSKVYLADVDHQFIDSAKILSSQLEIDIAGFIQGDEEALLQFPFNESPSIVVGTDVIEHIYDPNRFLTVLHTLNKSMAVGFTTASNPYNFLKIRKLQKLQDQDEKFGSDGNNIADPTIHKSFLEIRKEIIRNHMPALQEEVIADLAKRTRGLRENDIVEALLKYQKTGELPAYPTHPTNTAHPRTGSWTERILSVEEYQEIFNRNNFSLNIFYGFYNDLNPGIGKIPRRILNMIPGNLGKNISPFIGLVGLGK